MLSSWSFLQCMFQQLSCTTDDDFWGMGEESLVGQLSTWKCNGQWGNAKRHRRPSYTPPPTFLFSSITIACGGVVFADTSWLCIFGTRFGNHGLQEPTWLATRSCTMWPWPKAPSFKSRAESTLSIFVHSNPYNTLKEVNLTYLDTLPVVFSLNPC